ncbi:TonB-dependent siderophore receptor [Qipengyuania sp. XHP0211]|uniref:TonB-dependent receptor n=1 Tax=Qipengyuania sp. XHP0211 TaxID=3038079 RepID=UPI00241E8383|nr:TonB-dependent siderophore receptor [Qipengyuania sp. XHP0211]MDG5750059.1 TonB-dependent siderophore receptor [Qipengyuania sp. XHP0211]
MNSMLRVSILALGASIAATAQAQDTSDDVIIVTAQRENATQVVNAGSAGVLGNKNAEDLPFTIRSYDESLILNQQPQTLGDVLENDPTIRTTYGFGNASEQFVIRGFTLFGDDVGVNGLYGIAPRQLVAPELYGSVQVLNGSSAFLNGAAPGGTGLGGSVNLMLKRAGASDLNRVTVSAEQSARFGGAVDVSRRFGSGGEWGLRINGAYRDGETSIDEEYRRTAVIGGALDYDSGPLRAAIDLAYQEIRVDNLRPKVTIATSTVPVVPDADANYAQDFAYSDLSDVFGTFGLEYDVADNATLYARGGARDGTEAGQYASLTLVDADTGAANGGSLFVPATSNNEAIEAGLRVRLGERVTQEINFGGNISWQVFRTAFDFGSGYATNLYDTPQVALPPGGFIGGDLDDPQPITKTRLASAFASDTIGLWGDRILLTGGLRLQDIRQENINYDGTPGATYDESAVTPVAGLVVKPVSGLSLYANRIEALQQGPVAPIDPGLVTNPGEVLAPRKSVQYEVGGKLALGGLFVGLGAYRIERPGEGVLDDGSFGYLGDQRHRGVELTVNGEVAPGLRLIGGAALTDAELIGGNEVPGVPDFTANADVEWDLGFAPGLTLTGRAVHTGEQWVDAANTLTLDSWTRFDLGARYVFVAGEAPITLRLSVDNVANERYWASSFDAFSAALLQGRPRTFKASVSADF